MAKTPLVAPAGKAVARMEEEIAHETPLTLKFLHCGNVSMSDEKDADQKNIFYIPMGVFSLANEARREGADVEIVHSDLQAGLPIAAALDLQNIDAIGFDLHWANQSLVVLETAKAIKAIAPHVFTFTGGFTASYFSTEIVRDFPQIDAVCRGDSERPVRQLVAALREAKRRGKQTDRPVLDELLDQVQNLTWRRADGQVTAKPIQYVVTKQDLESFNFTSFHLMRDWELYKSLSRFWTHYDELATPPLFFMQPARGCRYTCKFCGGNAVAQNLMNGRKGLAFRSAESCLDTIKQALAAGYGTIYTSMEDVDSDDWYIDLLDQCQKEQLELNYVYGSWRCPSEELIDKLSETCEHALIEISPESAVEEIRRLNRDKRLFFSNAELEERLEHVAKKKNVRVQLYFGFYQVGETVETVDETIQFILRCVRRFPGFLEIAYGAYSTDPGSLLQSDPDRYGVTMAPRHLKDYVTSLRRSFIEEKSLDTEMTLFRPAGISEEDDRAVRRRVLLLRALFSGFRKTTSHLLARPGGEALIQQILSRSEVPLTGKEVIAPATLLRLIAGAVHEGGELDELFLRILSLDYQELLSRPATLSPTSFFFRDDEIGGAAAIHPDVERYKAFLDTRGAAQIGTEAPSWYRVAEAFGHAERYWAEKAAAAAEAPTIDLADTSPPLVLPYLGDEPLAVLAAAAWQVLAARYTRTPSAPALLAAGARRPFLIHTQQNPDAPVRELLAAVAAEVREAAAQAFYLEQPALPPQIEQAFSRPGTLVLTTAGQTGADLPPGKSERLAAWLLQGMAWLAGHPDAPLREVSFVPPGEHRTIVSTFNQTHREVPLGSLLHHFEAAVQKHGNRPAVRFRSAAMTYRQLDGRANQIARILRDCGLPGSRRVGVMLPTSDGLVSTLLGVLKTGSAFVPVDAGAPPVRRAAQLRDVGVDLVVTTPDLAPAVAPQLPGVRICAIDSAATFPASAPEGARLTEPVAESPAYVIFTSGSTGRPKGVEVTHGNLVNFCLWRIAEYGLTEADVTYSVLPYYFDGFLSTLFPTLLAGGCLVLAPDESRRDVSHLKETLAGGVTNTALVPTIFEPLLAACTPEDVASLRWVVVGGEKLSAGRLAALQARFPGVRFINEYGPTETTVACLANPSLDSARPANVGRPIANTRVYILDPHLNLVPLGFPGEICVAGHGVANGYVGPAAGEASGFVAHPHEPGRRMYRTGDLGFWHADGTVDLLGRVDTQLKIRGHRIELGEIEEALCQHEDILDAVVVPVESQGRTAELCGFFVARAPVGERALAEHLSARLPSFMIPQQLLAVAAIPLTATGKKDRCALRERVPRAAGEGVQADPEIAETVRSAIAGVLRIDARMDGSASFLQLGGDSIHMIILQRGLARELGVEIPLLDLLSARSIRDLIETVAKAVDARQIPHGPERFVRLSGKDGERSFFFLHDVSGEVAVYDALSRSLPAGFEYWGVRAHDLVKLAPARRRLQHLAQEYLHDILSRNKSDVFFLGGWSLGGVIAYEIARQLERLGKTVGALVLIDAPSPGTGQLERPGADVAQERAWVERSFRGEAVRALAEPIETRTVEEYWTLFAARLDQENVPDTALLAAMPEEIAKIISKYPQHGSAALLHQMNTVRTIVGAWAAYDPAAMGKIAADLTFVRPSESDPRAAELWARQTTGACEVAAVRGDHWSIFLRENMGELAAVLSATLEAGLRQHKAGSDGERLVGELAANLLKFEESPDSPDLNAEHWRELSRAKPGGAARSTPYGPNEARSERFGQAAPDSLRKIQTVP